MGKYIIEIKPEYEDSFKGVMILGAKDSNLFVDTLAVENLEQYTPVDIEKIYDTASTDGYKRGLEDGKAVNDKGCEGCKYEEVIGDKCRFCANRYPNQWTAKDDKIEVGDIIANNTEPKLKVWVTCFDEIGFCGIAITDFGTVDEGKLYTSCSPKGWHKIGHFDITKILEDMRHD